MDAKGRVLSDESIAGEVPFELPEGWCWARLKELCEDVLVPQRDKPVEFGGTIPWCRIEDIEGDTISGSKTGKSVDLSTVESMNLKVNPVGTVLCSNSATIGVPAIVTTPLVTNQRFIGFVCAKPLHNWYLYYFFLANHGYLCGAGTGTTQSYIARSTFEQMLLPLPPLAEQRRIAERVGELMPLVEGFGELEDAREELDAALPGRLRRSVLQEAVRGRLAPQDASDEPAGELLGRIREERRRLAAEGKIRLPKGGDSVILTGSDGRRYEKRVDAKGRESEPVCIEDEIPFEIPDGWAWARLKSLGSIVGGGTPKTNDSSLWTEADDGIPWITPSDMRNVSDMQVSHGSRFLSEKGLSSSSAQLLPPGSVVMSSRAPIGYLAITACALTTNQGFKSLVPVERSLSKWVLVCLDALMEDIKRRASGTIFKEISGSEFGETLVPIAPLAEQARILSKMNRLRDETA